jgi:hypothetical protein
MAVLVRRCKEPTPHYEGDFANGYDMGQSGVGSSMDEILTEVFGEEWERAKTEVQKETGR